MMRSLQQNNCDLSRRAVLRLGGALTFAGVVSAAGCVTKTRPAAGRLPESLATYGPITLTAAEHPLHLMAGSQHPSSAWLYNGCIAPVIRARRGEEVTARLINRLPDGQHTTIHWHGVRLPNPMDGVPFLTQPPVYPGEDFTYRFAPPDAGTFFFHPHCNTVEQLGRGLAGVLIVDDDGPSPFDDDIICVLKDWRAGPDGAFLPFLTPKGAATSGSFGSIRTVNGLEQPALDVPPDAWVRLRLLNFDSTRINRIGLEGGQAAVIAIDGNPVAPFALSSWKLGPAMRVDLALRTGPPGAAVKIMDYFNPGPIMLAGLHSEGSAHGGREAPRALQPAAFRAPELSQARRFDLALGAGIEGAALPPEEIPIGNGQTIRLLDSLCLAPGTFWTLNGRAWPGQDHRLLPPPLFTVTRGETVLLSLFNGTPHTHPIHLHGHTFRVLRSTKTKRPVHDADTVLVMPSERVEIAFAADNPGDWMIHCHIIEHQETGMMGWFRVS